MALDPTSPPPHDPQDDTGDFPTPSQRSRAKHVRVEFGALTHPGRVRSNNEDHYLVAKLAKSMRICMTSLAVEDLTRFSDEEGYFLVVADGMGGAAAGERASALAVESVEAFVLNTLKWFLHLEGQEENALLGELRQGLERADRAVVDRARADASLAGMGTTLTMAYSVSTDLYIVHAGDSRAYLLRDGRFEQITSDHTLVQILVSGGALSPEQAKHHHRRNVVTNVVGGPRPGVFAEIHKVGLEDGDTLLLCSDGLTEPVPDDRIAEILLTHADVDADTACQHLVDTALAAGGPDNITAILARYSVGKRA